MHHTFILFEIPSIAAIDGVTDGDHVSNDGLWHHGRS